MTHLIRIVLTGLFALLLTSFAFAEEKIERFDVIIDVQTNGNFIITETIRVHAEGNQIRRGIFREIPRFLMDGKYKIPQQMDVFSVSRDGDRTPYSAFNNGNALQVRIGEQSVFLDPGAYAYEIKYLIENQVRYFKTHDEVYWNATGTYWSFPIDKATARIILPEGATVLGHDAYTGYRGATGQDYAFSEDSGAYVFESTRRLESQEGMTLSLSFDKGLIDPPTAEERSRIFWIKYAALVVLSLSFLAIGLYYYFMWNKVGRDPIKDPVFPRYEAPIDYSPGALSYIHFRHISGNKALIATLMRLAIDGYLTIDTKKGETTLKKVQNPDLAPPLYDDERLVFNRLFRKKDSTIILEDSDDSRLDQARIYMESHIRRKNPLKAFRRGNAGLIFWGIIASVAAGLVSLAQVNGYISPAFWMICLGLIVLNILFFKLMPAPTRLGQDLKAEIDGLMLYMEKAEMLRMNAHKISGAAPPMTPERYERFLPYAIALGLEKPWSAHFEAALPDIAKTYQPTWTSTSYSGRGSRSYESIPRMTRSIVQKLDSGVAAARPMPSYTSGSSSSSSGSSWSSGSSGGGYSGGGGGGGSSGGGGGGGGGGGW